MQAESREGMPEPFSLSAMLGLASEEGIAKWPQRTAALGGWGDFPGKAKTAWGTFFPLWVQRFLSNVGNPKGLVLSVPCKTFNVLVLKQDPSAKLPPALAMPLGAKTESTTAPNAGSLTPTRRRRSKQQERARILQAFQLPQREKADGGGTCRMEGPGSHRIQQHRPTGVSCGGWGWGAVSVAPSSCLHGVTALLL